MPASRAKVRPVKPAPSQPADDRYSIAALDKGVRVLRLFGPDSPTITIAEAARHTNTVPSSVLRILSTLVDLGFCEELPGPCYRPAEAALRLGNAAVRSDPLRRVARSVLEKLSQATGESAVLGVLVDGRFIMHIDHVEGPTFRGDAVPVGARFDAAKTPVGRAILAEAYSGRDVVVPIARNDLTEEVARAIRSAGFAISDDSAPLQVRCVAAVIREPLMHAGAAVGIFVPGIKTSAARLRNELAPLAVGAAAEIAALCYLHRTDAAAGEPPAGAAVAVPGVGGAAQPRSRYHIEALSRGFRVLQAFVPPHLLHTVPTLAASTGLPASAVFRIVRTLLALGLLRQQGSAYSLSLAAMDLGYTAVAGQSAVELAAPLLQSLRERFGGLAFMSVLAGHESIDVAKFVGAERSVHGTIRYPLYATAGGKVLLAFAPTEVRNKIIDELEFVAHAPHTIRGSDQLRKELAIVRERGFAINNEEFHVARWAAAAPITDSQGRCIAAMGLLVDLTPSVGDLEQRRMISEVVATAARISRRLDDLFA